MTTRRIEHLIRRIRRDTGNTDYSPTSGIPQRDIAEYLNDAQTNIQIAIAERHSTAFVKQTFLDTVSGQEAYDLPADALFEASPRMVEYSTTGFVQDFYALEKRMLLERQTRYDGEPWFYFRRGGQILLNPTPQRSVTGGLRIQYPRRLPALSVRSGVISAVTLNTGTRQITALTINPAGSVFSPTELLEDDFLCIVSRDGEIKMAGVPIDGINTATGVVTLGTGFTYQPGETATNGDFVVSGRYATTHSELEPTVERYLIAYGVWKVQKRDSNDDSVQQTEELLAMLNEIVDSYNDLSQDVDRVAVLTDWEI